MSDDKTHTDLFDDTDDDSGRVMTREDIERTHYLTMPSAMPGGYLADFFEALEEYIRKLAEKHDIEY